MIEKISRKINKNSKNKQNQPINIVKMKQK